MAVDYPGTESLEGLAGGARSTRWRERDRARVKCPFTSSGPSVPFARRDELQHLSLQRKIQEYPKRNLHVF